jgi:hypothetical protein
MLLLQELVPVGRVRDSTLHGFTLVEKACVTGDM